ncbi:MAG: hypothetical protein TU36_004590 [Vulcanisaeta sp. AZ3]|jgi:hypothetical protein
MLSRDALVRVGRLPREFRLDFHPFSLLFSRRARLRVVLAVLELALNLIGSGVPNMMPSSVERGVIISDTEWSLVNEFKLNSYVTIKRVGRDYFVTVRASPSLAINSLIHCNGDCEYYFDKRVMLARNCVGAYGNLILDSLSILSKLFSAETPRVVLTHNPVVYGKVIQIDNDEVIALSIWDVLRVVDTLAVSDYTVDNIMCIIDTLVHEFLHYLLDKRYLVHSIFLEMTKRNPSALDVGIIHELIAQALTPIISRYVSQCVKNGVADEVNNYDVPLIGYPVKRRYVIVASKVINELLSALNGGCR